jgi:formiminotetrahydrofolate cyclodeaminase
MSAAGRCAILGNDKPASGAAPAGGTDWTSSVASMGNQGSTGGTVDAGNASAPGATPLPSNQGSTGGTVDAGRSGRAEDDAGQADSKAAQSVAAYLDALASSAPAPGGGSAAALVGAMGIALVSMVANFTVGRPRYAAVEDAVRPALDEAERSRAELLRLMEEDEQAYLAYGAATKLPRATEEERRARSSALQRALRDATAPPLAMARLCRRGLDLAGVVAESGNPNLASDAGVAALLAEAALRASIINVRVNLAQIRSRAFVEQTEAELDRLVEGTPSIKEAILATAGRRMVGE